MDRWTMITTTSFTFLLIGLTCEACPCVEFQNLPPHGPRPGMFCSDGTRQNNRPLYHDSHQGNYLYYDSVGGMWKAGTSRTDFYFGKLTNDTVNKIIFKRDWMVKIYDGNLVPDNNLYLVCAQEDGRVEPGRSGASSKVVTACTAVGVVLAAVVLVAIPLKRSNVRLRDVCGCCCEVLAACLRGLCDCVRCRKRRRRPWYSTTEAVSQVRDQEDITRHAAPLYERSQSMPAVGYTVDLHASSNRSDLLEGHRSAAPPPVYDRALDMPRPSPNNNQSTGVSQPPPEYDQSLDMPRSPTVSDPSITTPRRPPATDQPSDLPRPPPMYDQALDMILPSSGVPSPPSYSDCV